MLTDAIKTLLESDPAIAEVGVYANVGPQGANEFVVYQIISGRSEEVLAGSSGLARTMVQVVCWSRQYRAAWERAKAVRRRLQAQQGTFAGHYIDWINRIGERDFHEQPDSGGALGHYGALQEFAIWHAEALPAAQ